MPAACGPARSAAWSGLELPVLAMEHHTSITDEIPEVAALRRGAAAAASTSRARSTCARRARASWSAPTSRTADPGREHTTPHDFGHELLAPDLDRIAPRLEVGFEHFPALGRGRHQERDQRALHLRARRQPAGRPGQGPAEFLGRLRRHGRLQPGRRRRPDAVAAGCPRAIRARTSWRWMSPASAASRRRAYTNAKVHENYRRRFRITFPNEELPAARPLRTTPVYDRLKARAPCSARASASSMRSGSRRTAREPYETPTFRRSNAHEPVPPSAARCARPSACSRPRTTPSTRSRGLAPRPGSDGLLANHLPKQGSDGADADAEPVRPARSATSPSPASGPTAS